MKHVNTTRLTLPVTLAIAAFALPANAQFLPFDDFEDETPGLIDNQDNWDSSGGVNRVIADPADPTNQVLEVPSSSSTLHKSLLPSGLEVLDGQSRTLFLRLRVAQKQTFSLGLSFLNSPSEYSDFAPEIGMANSAQNLDLRAWDDDGSNYTNIAQLAPDTWYNMWVDIDSATNTYSVSMNANPCAGATNDDRLADASGDDIFEFRAGNTSDLVSFYIRTSGGSSGTNFGPIYIDDIYLETADGFNPANPLASSADLNRDGILDLSDITRFVSAFLSGEPEADMNRDGLFDLPDITRFITAFTAGCA